MTAIEIQPDERYRLHGTDPADIAAAADEAADRISEIIGQLREPWMDEAACRTIDVQVFFARNAATALATCGTCEVMLECREFAIGTDSIVDGVFGGMTPSALRQARRSRHDATGNHTYSARCTCPQCRSHRAETMRSWRRATGRTGPT